MRRIARGCLGKKSGCDMALIVAASAASPMATLFLGRPAIKLGALPTENAVEPLVEVHASFTARQRRSRVCQVERH